MVAITLKPKQIYIDPRLNSIIRLRESSPITKYCPLTSLQKRKARIKSMRVNNFLLVVSGAMHIENYTRDPENQKLTYYPEAEAKGN